jgi:transposase
MKSPPSSPDLNPIELVWHDLKQHVRKCRCTTEKEIIQACQEFQNKMTPEYCQKYINKLKEVIQIVIKKKENGQAIKKIYFFKSFRSLLIINVI